MALFRFRNWKVDGRCPALSSWKMAPCGVRYFNGHVFAFSFLKHDAGFAHYQMTLRPWLAFLRQRRNNCIFHGKTRRADPPHPRRLPDARLADPPARPRCADERAVQFAEDDHNYLHRRWEAQGGPTGTNIARMATPWCCAATAGRPTRPMAAGISPGKAGVAYPCGVWAVNRQPPDDPEPLHRGELRLQDSPPPDGRRVIPQRPGPGCRRWKSTTMPALTASGTPPTGMRSPDGAWKPTRPAPSTSRPKATPTPSSPAAATSGRPLRHPGHRQRSG